MLKQAATPEGALFLVGGAMMKGFPSKVRSGRLFVQRSVRG